MAFPFTHLCVGFELLKAGTMTEKDAAQFMLGCIAPDAIHYRKSFVDSKMKEIGPAKKITHLCPVSDERWGAVTDNTGWMQRVHEFLAENPRSPLHLGYAVHVLTDIRNNMTLWQNFRTVYPSEAAKGYASSYYTDLREIDMRLYYQIPYAKDAMELLLKSDTRIELNSNGKLLAASNELEAIKHNLIHENYKNAAKNITPGYKYVFVTYDDVLEYINNTVKTILSLLIKHFDQLAADIPHSVPGSQNP